MSFFIRPVKKNIDKISLAATAGLSVEATISNGSSTIGTKSSSAVAPPAAILKSVEITTQGIGLLTRCKATVHVYSATAFGTFYDNTVKPGASFTIKYGRPGGTSRSKKFRTYNFKMKMDKLGGFEATVEGVAAGANNIVEGPVWHNFNVLRSDRIGSSRYFYPVSTPDKYHCDGSRNPFEYMVSEAFKIISNDHGSSCPDYSGAWTCGAFGYSGVSGPNSGVNMYFVAMGYNMAKWNEHAPQTKLSGKGVFGRATEFNVRIPATWYSLATIFRYINEYVLGDTGYEISWNSSPGTNDGSVLFTFGEAGPEWAVPPDPFRVIWALADGPRYEYRSDDLNATVMATSLLPFAISSTSVNGQDCYNPMGIFISEMALHEIFQDAQTSTPEASGNQEDVEKNKAEFKLIDFSEKLFKMIRESFGGALDLTLDVKSSDSKQILIVNKNSVPEKPDPNDVVKLSIYGGSPKDYGIRDISLTGKVPKDLVAKMFGTAPDTTETTPALVSSAQAVLPNTSGTEPETTGEEMVNLIGEGVGLAGNQTGKAHMKNWVSYYKNTGKLPAIEPSPLPLDLGFTVDGGAILEFGNIVNLDGLPGILSGNDQVYWTITDVTDKIEGNDWTTSCKTVARLIPS